MLHVLNRQMWIDKCAVTDCSFSSVGSWRKKHFFLRSRGWGSVNPGRQWEWQTCCHTAAGGGAILGLLFTVCLFPSNWDLIGRAGGQGQLVIRKLWMPGIPARSVNSKGARHAQLCLFHTGEAFPRESRLLTTLCIHVGGQFASKNIWSWVIMTKALSHAAYPHIQGPTRGGHGWW